MIFGVIFQILGFVGSLCLLLFGMNMLSNGIQKGAGNNLQKLLGKIAGNRFTAVLTGIGVTAIIQSSGATTVMVVSFVNAEILTLPQAIGVIFGANIGTTVTAWLVSLLGFSFSISAMAIPLFGFGYIIKRFKKLKLHNFSDCFMGFALLFIGLDLLKEALKLGDGAQIFLSHLNDLGILGIIIGIIIGAAITALLHSSSAMTAIVLTMAASKSLSWELSCAIVLGSNIGSTIDAVMSSIGASTNAKRTALIHVSFNVIGTLIALCVFKPFLRLVDLIVPLAPSDNITTHIAMLHTVFNISATLIFIPFVNQIASIATKIIPEPPKDLELHYYFPAVIPHSRVSADLYAFQIKKEITKMCSKNMEMFEAISRMLLDKSSVEVEKGKVIFLEEYIDEMHTALSEFMQKCLRLPTANSAERKNFIEMIRVTDNLEDLSDEMCSITYSMEKYLKNDSPDRIKELYDYFELAHIFYEQVSELYAIGISDDQRLLFDKTENTIDTKKKELQINAQNRLENGADVKDELQYMDLVRRIEKVGDFIYSIVRS
ncbi:MAG: Na/Pi cotransporter family protein [Treponema sp.]|nr:Na/Pi cotransporter family protein [Treponema sp.]